MTISHFYMSIECYLKQAQMINPKAIVIEISSLITISGFTNTLSTYFVYTEQNIIMCVKILTDNSYRFIYLLIIYSRKGKHNPAEGLRQEFIITW